MFNAIKIFVIISHFTDKKRRLQALFLAMVEVEGVYISKQLATQIFEVLD